MRAEIKDGQFTALSKQGDMTYTITNWEESGFSIFNIYNVDDNGNKMIIPTNITDNTCEIILNPDFLETNENE